MQTIHDIPYAWNIHDVTNVEHVHLKKEVGGGGLERVAYIPYPNLLYESRRLNLAQTPAEF
ncbi:hypothetical protein C8039_05130 [Halogeometricum sp. wsp3]|nr:hypothetical protein C8039_05130 [Halogeometricum sp. wsp3]